MLNKTDEPNTLPLIVVFLRFYARMTQAELGQAAGVEQGLISKYEAGHQQPPEESLKRMARAVGIPWGLVGYLRRVYSAVIRLSRRRELITDDFGPETFEEMLDQMLVALSPYLVEVGATLIAGPSPEERRQEAEQVWKTLEALPMARRRRILELSVNAGKNGVLAEKLCDASLQKVASDPEDALGLADLALTIARRVEEGNEYWRRRLEGYCWAHIARARRAVEDTAGAESAKVKAWTLWEQGRPFDPGLLSESRMRELLGEKGAAGWPVS